VVVDALDAQHAVQAVVPAPQEACKHMIVFSEEGDC
jgi:hypothetical protein